MNATQLSHNAWKRYRAKKFAYFEFRINLWTVFTKSNDQLVSDKNVVAFCAVDDAKQLKQTKLERGWDNRAIEKYKTKWERHATSTPIGCLFISLARNCKFKTTYHDSRCIRQAGSRVAPKPAPICTAPSHHWRYIANSSTRYHSACFLGGESQCTMLTRTSWQPVITFLRSVLYLLSWRTHHTVLATQPDCSAGLDCCDTSDGSSAPTSPPGIEPSKFTNTYELCRARSAPTTVSFKTHVTFICFFFLYLCSFFSSSPLW